MRKVFILLYLVIQILCLPVHINAQCIANAGKDTVLCLGVDGVDTTILGGNPTANGGMPPYTYCWETTVVLGTSIFHASDFLDDTSVANPKLVSWYDQGLEFHLKITDALGSVCKDTVRIHFSVFYVTLLYYTFYISLGDSVPFFMTTPISDPFPPYTYLWQPTNGLTDSTNLNTWAKPTISTTYNLTVTDSYGCSATAGPYYIIMVSPAGIEQVEHNSQFKIYPNPLPRKSILKMLFPVCGDVKVDFFDSFGKLVKHFVTSCNDLEISSSDFSSSIYFYMVSQSSRIISSGKLIVE